MSEPRSRDRAADHDNSGHVGLFITKPLSDHDRRVIFGLPGVATPTAEIRWPCGAIQTIIEVQPGRSVKMEPNCRLLQRAKGRKLVVHIRMVA